MITKIIFYFILVIIFIVLVILIIGLCLPKIRVVTKETEYDASVEKVFNTVTNNRDWKYRTSLDDLKIIESRGDIEIWDEFSGGNVIRFTVKDKKPYSVYSFEMESKLFKGYWIAEFESVSNEKTRFKATESIEYRYPFIKVIAFAFMNLDNYMETYQNELRNKLGNNENQ